VVDFIQTYALIISDWNGYFKKTVKIGQHKPKMSFKSVTVFWFTVYSNSGSLWDKCKYAHMHPLSLRLTTIFPGELRLAGFVEAKDDGCDGNNWSYTSCKAPVKLSPPTNQYGDT